jgi:hypothetical protein
MEFFEADLGKADPNNDLIPLDGKFAASDLHLGGTIVEREVAKDS